MTLFVDTGGSGCVLCGVTGGGAGAGLGAGGAALIGTLTSI